MLCVTVCSLNEVYFIGYMTEMYFRKRLNIYITNVIDMYNVIIGEASFWSYLLFAIALTHSLSWQNPTLNMR